MPKRVLIVDDDRDDQLLICEALKDLKAGIECELASDGQEALDQINTPPPFDIVFLDLNMPVMNGFETLTVLKNDDRYKNIPVVILTTSNNRIDQERCKQIGADHYFTKPASFPKLLEGLQNILSTIN